jgi:predicted ribosome quality control (RQC) complex YloA/Tae2 family protein
MNIEGISLYVLARELNTLLAGSRVTRVLQPTRSLFVFHLRQPQQDYSLLVSVDPGDPRVHLTADSRENPLEPSSFCMLLRKHLIDGRVAGVFLSGLDRVLHIPVDIRGNQNRIDTKTLTIELTGKNSNLIFSVDGLIVDALRRVGHNTSRIRQILPGIPYVGPPTSDRLSPICASPADIIAAVRQNPAVLLSKALQSNLEGVGRQTIDELLHQSSIPDNTRIDQLETAQWQLLTFVLETFQASLQNGSTEASVTLNESGRLLAVSPFPLQQFPNAVHQKFSSMSDAIAFAASLAKAPKATGHQELIKRMRTESEKLQRKEALLKQEHIDSNQADIIRRNADLLMVCLLDVPVGATTVTLPDLFSPDAAETSPPVEISLDPLLSALDNAQRYYKKYARAKRAQALIEEQMAQCRNELDYIEGILLQLEESATNQELLEITHELSTAGYIRSAGKVRLSARPSDPRKCLSPSGAVILVGRNNRQNDTITFKIAQPRDLWFHTKDIPGSHVIMKPGDPAQLEADMEKAAQLAAWFSKARASSNVPVDYTERRHVKKPSGAKPGFVIYERQKTLWVTPDEATIKTLVNY